MTASPGTASPGAPPLGRLLVLTDRHAPTRPLVDVVAAAVEGGARAVVLREKDLPDGERARLADAVRGLLAPVGGTLVLAGRGLAGDALHLSATDVPPDPRPALLGRSCHDAAELGAAAREGCDWVTLSPVFATQTKPGYGPALGLDGLAALSGDVPVYALGGVTADRAPGCLAAGAAGVAVLGAVMRAPRPDRVVADLLRRLD